MLNTKAVDSHNKQFPKTYAGAYFDGTVADKIRKIGPPKDVAKNLGISYTRFMRCLDAENTKDWFSARDATLIDLYTKNTQFFISKHVIRPDVFPPISGRKK